jgi:hypothetical protein
MFRPIGTAKVSFMQLKLDAIQPDKYRSAYRGELGFSATSTVR